MKRNTLQKNTSNSEAEKNRNIVRRSIKFENKIKPRQIGIHKNPESQQNDLKNAKITLVPDIRKPDEFSELSLSEALEQIKSDEYQDDIDTLRALDADDQPEQKKKLPAFAFSGLFSEKVDKSSFRKPSGILILDIDHLKSEDIETSKSKISEISNVLFCFVSPRGNGLKVGVRVPPESIKSDADFKRIFYCAQHMFSKHGFEIDKACKDVRRLCFVSHDPDMYINWNAEVFDASRHKSQPSKTDAPLTAFNLKNERKQIAACVDILARATPGNRHHARLEAGNLAGALIAGGQVHENKITNALLQASDRIADGASTTESERKTLLDAIEHGKIKPIYPAKESFNAILDTDRINCKVDLLRHVRDDHLLKELAIQIAKETKLPVNTVFLAGLGTFSSMAARCFVVQYENGQVLPIGLFIVLEQPSGAGKTRCNRIYATPFIRIHKELANDVNRQIDSLNSKDKKKKLSDAEQVELEDLKKLAEHLKSGLFITDPTPEGLEITLHDSNGYFAVVSTEQSAFNSLFGLYKPNKTANNNDVVLNGFDGGHINSARVSRKGYSGFVIGSILCFSQQGSIEKLLGASNGTGLAERFLMLAEPHNLGKRDHNKIIPPNRSLLIRYADACEFFTEAFPQRRDLHELPKLKISESGFHKIRSFQNEIEHHLADGGKYSHTALRGAASKMDMQIMKMAANLHLMDQINPHDIEKTIGDEHVDSAIAIARELLEANLKLCQDKGIIGLKADISAVIKYLENRFDGRSEREIINSLVKTLPFRDYTGNKSELVRKTLAEMVDQNLLVQSTDGLGKSIYKLAQ